MKLLPLDSLTYRRRLVRALNRIAIDGFYAAGHVRCNQAKLVGEVFQVRSIDGHWSSVTDEYFVDVYGREVCASRQV